MIYDRIENCGNYYGISEWLDKAIVFIQSTDLNTLPLGKTELCGDKLFINVMEAETRLAEEGFYEIHRKYLDIQIDLEGTECVKFGTDASLQGEFDIGIDFGNVTCRETASCILGEGRFVICMAKEPHKPGIAVNDNHHLKKCVFKVAAD